MKAEGIHTSVWQNTFLLFLCHASLNKIPLFPLPSRLSSSEHHAAQYEKILADMESVGIEQGDIYKSCEMLARRQSAKMEEQCKTEDGQRVANSGYREFYELMVKEEDATDNHRGRTRLSLVDFGWAKLGGSYTCGGEVNDAPEDYSFNPDRGVFDALDRTFQRHLRLEQHLLVDWTQRYDEEEVREAMRKFPKLVIREASMHPAIEDEEERANVFSKFHDALTDDFRGRTPFTMYVVYDIDPKYEVRATSRGDRPVNLAMFDFERALREGTGGGSKIHATRSIQETKDIHRALGKPQGYQQRHFESLKQVFNVLNFSRLRYVILQNYEGLPDEVTIDPDHPSVDILVDDYYAAKRILDGDSPKDGVLNSVLVGSKIINFNIRSVGDGHLDEKWQRDILERSTEYSSGIPVPSEEDRLNSLILRSGCSGNGKSIQ